MAVIVSIGILLKRRFVPLMNTVKMYHSFYLLLILLLSAGSVLIYFVVFLLLQGIADNAALREQNLELGFREQYYTPCCQNGQKRLRHDLFHHLRLLSGYLEARDYDGALAYLKEYINTVGLEKDVFYCANPAGNLILNYYAGLASLYDIRMDVEARLPEQLFIQVSDICMLLGNILENAIEGCQRQSLGEKWILVRLMADEDKIAVTIDNSCGETKQGRDGRFLSTKNGRQGIGLTSLTALAKKYDGSAWFESSDGVFNSSVVLHAQPVSLVSCR